MVTRKIIWVVSLLLVTTQISSCFLFFTDPPEETSYSFSVTASIYPSKGDTINIGDTLYLISSFPTKLTDVNTGAVIDYSHSTALGGTMGFSDFNNLRINQAQDSTTIKYFQYVKLEGNVYNDTSVPIYWSTNQTRYEEKNGNYYLKIGMIPKKKGLFYFGINDLLSNGQVGNKKSASFSIRFENTDQHLHYYEDKFGYDQLSDHDREHAYCFVVN